VSLHAPIFTVVDINFI